MWKTGELAPSPEAACPWKDEGRVEERGGGVEVEVCVGGVLGHFQ